MRSKDRSCLQCQRLIPCSFTQDDAPVSASNVASSISGDTTTVNDDSEDHEAQTCENLDRTEYEFDLRALIKVRL